MPRPPPLLLLLLLLLVGTAHAAILQSRTIGNITYGPGVCGATVNCTTSGALLGLVEPGKVCGVDYVCNATTPYGVCSPTGCSCTDLCVGGGLCSIWQKDKIAAVPLFYSEKTVYATCGNLTQLAINATVAQISGSTHWPLTPVRRAYETGLIRLTPLAASVALPCGGRCNTTTQACVKQTNPGVAFQNVVVDGVLTPIMNSEVCCPRGFQGDACEIPVGCSEGGCDHGGLCLRATTLGVPLAPRDTRCFGCPPGTNTTGPGWGGLFCHVRNTPTFVFRNATTGTVSGRRLLATQDELFRASQDRNTAASGAIFQEPSRTCDCAVRWSSPVVDTLRTTPVLLMGNVSASLTSGNATLLSTIQFGIVSGVTIAPHWHRRVRSLAEAKWLCSRDWGSGGFDFWNSTADATFIGSMSCTAGPLLDGRRAAATVSPANSPSLFPGGTMQHYALSRIEDTARCPDATLDRDWYCATYPTQCAAILTLGGVGNKRLSAGLSANETLRLAAVMHFSLFGHLVRNAPNSLCDLTSDWAEDETGCVNRLRAPKSLFPLPANTTLTGEICGNISRIEPARIAFGPLRPLATGTNVSDSGHSMCQCNPPFRPTVPATATDCAYDMCGTVDGRGRVNASWVGSFNHSATEACVCTGVWGTDPRTCSANTCSWCGATICQNLGTVNGTDYRAACACLPIFTGDLCQTSLCNVTNTHPFNATLWQGYPPSTVVCDCKDGYTGTFCDDLQCVHGEYSYAQRTCTCVPGFHGPQCQYSICAAEHGLFLPGNGTVPDACECFAPWTGATCEEHTCDADNAVLGIPGWAGVRPFGRPIPSAPVGGVSMWECGCTFPYAPTSFSETGRPLNCYESVCGQHGSPNANASHVLVPTDACTCSDPYSKGITTDPAACQSFSLEGCRNPCSVATCGLSQAEINVVGYVPIASGDASCCRCPASVGYFVRGECQPFCAFTQPCITSLTSSFLEDTSGVNVTSGTEPGDNTVRVSVGGGWECACNAGFFTKAEVGAIKCTEFAAVPRDQAQNVSGFDFAAAPLRAAVDDSSSSAGPPVNTIAIGLAGGLVGLLLVAGVMQQVAAKPAAALVGKAIATTTTTTTTVTTSSAAPAMVGTGRKGRVGTAARYGRLTIAMALLSLVTAATAVPLTWQQVVPWATNTNPDGPGKCIGIVPVLQPGAVATSPVSFVIPPGAQGFVFPGENWNGYPLTCGPQSQFTVVQKTQLLFGNKQFVMPGDGSVDSTAYADQITTESVTWSFDYNFRGIVSPLVKVGSQFIPGLDVSFSTPNFGRKGSNGWGLALNTCDFLRTCNGHGNCTSRYGYTPTEAAGSGFVGCDRYSTSVTSIIRPPVPDNCPIPYTLVDGTVIGFVGDGTARNERLIRDRYEVRGCLCQQGWGGLRCDVACPTGVDARRDICTGHGVCESKQTATRAFDAAACLCVPSGDPLRGCICDQGWTGEYCEIAVQSIGQFDPQDDASPILRDWSTCCPFNHPTCAPMQVAAHLVDKAPYGAHTCTPTGPCTVDAGCPCTTTTTATITTEDWDAYKDGIGFKLRLPRSTPYPTQSMPFPNADLLSVRVPAGDPVYNPYKCGEGDIAGNAGWIPEGNLTGGSETRGHGKCWIGMGTDSGMDPSKGYCICSNPNLYNILTGDLISQQRRGWFGSRCQFRTCTRRLAGAKVPDTVPVRRPTLIRYGVLSNPGAILVISPLHPQWVNFGARTVLFYNALINTLFGDPAPGQTKQLELTLNGQATVYDDWQRIFLTGHTGPLSVPTGLTMPRDFDMETAWRVRFGVLGTPALWLDIDPTSTAWTALGRSFVLGNGLLEGLFGDPAPGSLKQLEVTQPDTRTVNVYNYGETVKLADLIQCTGHGAGQLSSRTYNYADDQGPCDDKPVDKRITKTIGALTFPFGNLISNVNSVGRCKACDHGWGLYGNIHAMSLNGTTYNAADTGLCSERTFHSGSGAQCGGYGNVTRGPILTIQGKTVPVVTACDCNPAWGLQPYKDSGICQRTCAADEVLLSIPASVRDEFGNFNGTVAANFTLLVQLSARCGGLNKGLCRPITVGSGLADGLNSACMCNAGYGGPACTNLTSMWNQGALCGLRGEAVLTPISPLNSTQYSKKGYADEHHFNKYIVPLNGANITDPANAYLYTAYQCRCTAQALLDNWAVDTHGICAPTCSSVQLMGGSQNSTLCSGRGTCETDTRLGGIGKACRCELGWGGLNCGQRILQDRLAQVCGGADRGSLAYVPASANFSQQCVCNTGYTPNPHVGLYSGLCYRDCPLSGGLTCGGAAHGSCSADLVTGNDDVCHCDPNAWAGLACEAKLVGIYLTASGTQIVCTGHGLPHPDGIGACSCEPGWVGEACHVYTENRQCGTGNVFFDAESVGITVG